MKITDLPLSSSFSNTDVIPIEINGITYKVTGATLATALESIGSYVTGVKGNSETNYRTGNVNITPANIGLDNVDNTSDADKPVSTATQTALDALQAAILANFAGAFVQATAYPAGTYVTYTDGNLYILPNGHEANATWANTTKTQVSVGGELSDLKSALNDEIERNTVGYYAFLKSSFEQGDYNNGVKSDSSRAIRYPNPITILNGDKLKTKASDTLYLGWQLLDENGNILETGYQYSTYKVKITTGEHVFSHDGYLFIAVANGQNWGNSSAITPVDFEDGIIEVYNEYGWRIGQQLSIINSDMAALKNEIQSVADTGFMVNEIVWQRGGVDGSDGSITSQAYRATNTEPFTVTKDTKITLTNSLYRYGVYQIGSGTWSGWLTSGGMYNLETGKSYRFLIAKVTEDYIRLTDKELASMGDSLSLGTSVYDLLAESDNTERMAEYGSSAFNEFAFIIGVHYSSGSYYKDTARITNENPISFPYETRINVENGYRYAMIELDSEGTVVSTTSWLTTSYLVKANTNYYINIDNGNTSATAVVSLYISKLSYRTEIGYAIDRLDGVATYSYNGIDVAPQTHGFNTKQMPWNFSGPTTSGSYTPQAMGYYNGVVFKCWKDNLIQLYNFETGAKIAEYPATIGHGDCMDFSNEFYTSDDEFPLAYFSPDAETPTVYVNRLTRTGATLIRTLVFDVETVGYYTGCAVDGENNRLIILGYTKQAHATDDGTNFMVCTVWNLNNLINNGDTYTPELMKSFTLPFMATTQDQCYTDNKFYVISSKAEQDANTVIYVVDIGDESVVAKITDMPYKNWETEGIFWKGNKMYINGSGITEYSFVN